MRVCIQCPPPHSARASIPSCIPCNCDSAPRAVVCVTLVCLCVCAPFAVAPNYAITHAAPPPLLIPTCVYAWDLRRDMVSLKLQKRLAASVLKVSRGTRWRGNFPGLTSFLLSGCKSTRWEQSFEFNVQSLQLVHAHGWGGGKHHQATMHVLARMRRT
jgi:hypothetical protein